MYSNEEINELKEYKEGRMVVFKGKGEYLIDTPQRVLNVFYDILKWRFENHYYGMLKKPRLVLPVHLKKMYDEFYNELVKHIEENLDTIKDEYDFLTHNWETWNSWETESKSDYKLKYEKWNNWHLKVYDYLQNPKSKWEAVLFLNEMRCSECEDDFWIRNLELNDDNIIKTLEVNNDLAVDEGKST